MKKSNLDRHKGQSRHQDLIKARSKAHHTRVQRATVEDCAEDVAEADPLYSVSLLTLPYDLLQPLLSLNLEALADGFLAALSSSTNLAGKLLSDQVEAALTDALSGLSLYKAALWQGLDEAPAA